MKLSLLIIFILTIIVQNRSTFEIEIKCIELDKPCGPGIGECCSGNECYLPKKHKKNEKNAKCKPLKRKNKMRNRIKAVFPK
jgi:hypothetical protein